MRKSLSFLTITLILLGLIGSIFTSQTHASFFIAQGIHIAFHAQADLIMGSDFTFNVDTFTYGNGSIHIGGAWLNSTCDMTLTAYFSGNWFNYTVSSSGTQQISNGSKPAVVYIDGISKGENNGWTYSSGTVETTSATSTVSLNYAVTGDSPPDVGAPSASTAMEASTCTISCTLTDDVGLVSGILSTNRTSAWVNNTAKTLSGLSYAFSDSVVLPSAGTIFGYKLFVSDSAGQWATSSTYTFIVTSQGSTPSNSTTPSGFSKFLCMFIVTLNGRPLKDLKIRLWKNNYAVLVDTLTSDQKGNAETELANGSYEYSTEYNGQTKKGTILLDDVKKIPIEFESASKYAFDRSSLIKVSFALVVVACAIVAVLAVKNRH